MDLWTRALIIETTAASAAQAQRLWSTWPSPRKSQFERLVQIALRRSAHPVLAQDHQFPRAWRKLSSPPAGAWLLGEYNEQERRLGIVGARAAPPHRRRKVEDYAASCCAEGERVVSGAAVGVDSAAHRGASAWGSLVVIPFGIEHPLVGQGQVPAAAMLDGGGCIWSASLLRHGARARFVARNRLLAALCDRLVVAWAAPKSGSMHTVRFAAKLGIPTEAWWQEGDPPGNNGCRQLCITAAPPAELLMLMNQLEQERGDMARLPPDPSGLRALQMLELECGGWIRRLGCVRYTVIKKT